MVRRIDNDGTTIWTKYIENNQDTKNNSRRNTFSVGFSIVQVRIDLLASYWLKTSAFVNSDMIKHLMIVKYI